MEEQEAIFKSQTEMKKLGQCDVENARRRSHDTFCFLGGCHPEQRSACERGVSGGRRAVLQAELGGRLLYCFPLPKLQTLIVT